LIGEALGRRNMKSKIISMYSKLALAILINSCVFHHPSYPLHWSGLSENNVCPSVDGYYADIGEAENSSDYSPSLYASLIGGDLAGKDKVQFVKITKQTDKLLIEAFSKDRLIDKRVADFNSDDCENGFLKLAVPIPKPSRFLGIEWESVQISRSTDGALILRRNSGGVGFVLVVPVAGSQWSWYRFLKVKQ
jgi:hypothetical protein